MKKKFYMEVSLKMKKIFISFIMFFLIIFISNNVKAMTIVLDPGHGGDDVGSISDDGSIYERDINLKIARYLKSYLEEYESVNVILTHDGMETGKLDIYDRAMVARNQNADLIISLHINSVESGIADGAEVYVTANTTCKKYNNDTTELGNKILTNLSNLGIKNNGVKTRLIPNDETDVYSDMTRADYYGIIRYAMRGTKIDYGVVTPEGAVSANVENGEGVPALIVEHCYIKGTDVNFINSDSKIQALAKADADAIVEYYELQKKNIINNIIITDNYKINGTSFIVKPHISIFDIKNYYPTAYTNIENLPTGSKINIDGVDYIVTKMGDINEDGIADAIDLLLIKRHLLSTSILENENYNSANLNYDNIVDAIDLLLMKRHLLTTSLIVIK